MVRVVRTAFLLAACVVAWAGGASAQTASCDRLRADIAALDGAAARGRQQGVGETIRRQRAELERTIAYSRSIGCQRQRFLIFGAPPPAQCGPLDAQIGEMESNLTALESQVDRYAGGPVEAQRAALTAAYNAECRGQPAAGPRSSPGLLESLFGSAPEESMLPDELPPLQGADSAFGDGSYKTLCVRKCDGFYFPISMSASRSRFETDSAICQASCPNSEVELFVQPSGQEAEAAQSLTGEPYTSLPNAFRFRRAYDPACGCRRPGQSWVEALADAERIVGTRPGDIVVTEQKSLELARPVEPPKPRDPPPARTQPAAKAPPAKPAPGASAPAAKAPAGTLPGTSPGPRAAAPAPPVASSEPIAAPAAAKPAVAAGPRTVAGESTTITQPDGSQRTMRVLSTNPAPPKPQ